MCDICFTMRFYSVTETAEEAYRKDCAPTGPVVNVSEVTYTPESAVIVT